MVNTIRCVESCGKRWHLYMSAGKQVIDMALHKCSNIAVLFPSFYRLSFFPSPVWRFHLSFRFRKGSLFSDCVYWSYCKLSAHVLSNWTAVYSPVDISDYCPLFLIFLLSLFFYPSLWQCFWHFSQMCVLLFNCQSYFFRWAVCTASPVSLQHVQ